MCLDVGRQIIMMQDTISNLESQGSAEYKPTLLSGGEYEGANATHVNDDFMSQLGATVSITSSELLHLHFDPNNISSTIRTLFVPPAAVLPSSDEGDKLHQYTKRVAFHVFVISNHNQYLSYSTTHVYLYIFN